MIGKRIDWKELKFGVEIEFIGGGDPKQIELLPGWVMALDELQIDESGEESGSELKPPPIRWEDRGQIRAMLARLRAAGATANWSCGIHVHVGLEPWGEKAIPLWIEAALSYQDALRTLLDTSEDRLIYCPPVTPEMREWSRTNPTGESLCRPGRPQSHRCGINLAAWFDIGTVEIRYANGSLDDDEVLNTIELALRFVAAVGEGRELPKEAAALARALDAPSSGYPPAQPAPRWYRERMWLEDMLIPVLTPIAASLVPDGEILHIFPESGGLRVIVEDPKDGAPHLVRVRPTTHGWDVI
ncbi:amidoligase family protein [Cohnella panacarvi]|uniref:amidoligase family protein n=1 Tax=Cohnella panacarvi TaxID=400776 RepID=UPI000479FC5A|nr:amidoligase family protein [Cohnella panacarvi]